MHNLAITLKLKGHSVSGSDDEIYDPAKSQLSKHGLLPNNTGWNDKIITKDIDAIILGMHAKKDNTELLKAKEMDIPIYSFPEFIYKESINKTRVVIAGSHGKTSITSIIMHVLNHLKINFDYLVGARIKGFEQMTRLSDAPIIILEGDEYLSSPIDLSSKFIHYKSNIALITGIAWDHINVFKTFDQYCNCFRELINSMEQDAELIYFSKDNILEKIVSEKREDINTVQYESFPNSIENGITYLLDGNKKHPIKLFGDHNMSNIMGAYIVCSKLGVSKGEFLNALELFDGAAKRLELIEKGINTNIYKDFAHAPSKLMATTKAVKQQFPNRHLVACMELHTFSSLNKAFLEQYRGSMSEADIAIVYINKKYFDIKGLPHMTSDELKAGFDQDSLLAFFDEEELKTYLLSQSWKEKNLLMMSSGNFNGLSLDKLAKEIIK
jgi:UDP-N-acetylmuramate: L-alanyl-gamma-D-glutamyl-meso-diaminopimelate ligase